MVPGTPRHSRTDAPKSIPEKRSRIHNNKCQTYVAKAFVIMGIKI